MRQTFGRAVIASVLAVLLAASGAFGAASYPTSVKSFVTRVTGDVIQAVHINDLQDEVTAIEQGLLNGFDHTLRPLTATTRDLGTSAFPWRDFFLGRTATWTGNAHIFRSLTGTTRILLVTQGDNTATVTPTQEAFLAQTWLNAAIDTTFIAHRGDIFAHAGTGGVNIGVQGLAEALGTGTWGTGGTEPGLFGVVGYGISARGGRVWGGNFTARTTAIAAADANGLEIDLDTRIATTNRYGLTIAATTTGTVAGTTDDQMIRLINKTGGALWKDGVAFGGAGGVFPIATTGVLMRSIGAATVATGIDFSSLTISGDALKFTNFTLTGAGVVTVGAGTPFALYGGTGATALSTSATEFLSVSGIAAPVAAEGNIFQLVERAGSITSARALLSDAPGGTTTRTLTLMKGGVATGLTIEFGSADTAKASTGGPITVAAGDVLTWRSTLTGTPVAARVQGVTLRMRETAL